MFIGKFQISRFDTFLSTNDIHVSAKSIMPILENHRLMPTHSVKIFSVIYDQSALHELMLNFPNDILLIWSMVYFYIYNHYFP